MPKSDILPLRRWPCWPGPYSRRLTGLLGRPKTFSPMRRSSLYLALERFDMISLQFAFYIRPGTAPHGLAPCAITASPGMRDQLRAARLAEGRAEVKLRAVYSCPGTHLVWFWRSRMVS